MANKKPKSNVIEKNRIDESLAEIIAAAYDACLSDGNWSEILQRSCTALNADGGALISYDVANKSGRIHHAVGLQPGFARSYADYYSGHDVWLRRLKLPCRPGQAQASQQIVAECILVSSEFYNDWLAPQDFFHAMWGVLLCRDDIPLMLMLYRTEAKGPFGDPEIESCWQVLPHLQRALKIHELLSRAQLERDAALGALDHLPIGVVLLDRRGRVLETNSYANDILSMNDGLRIARDGFRTASRQETEQLRRMIAYKIGPERDATEEISDTLLITRPSGRPPFNALVAALPVGARFLGELRRAAALFITDPERHAEVNQRRLREIYDLTPAEARLASLIAQGWRLEDAAEDLGVSLNTVRTHLKRIFAKSGTDRQADLVRLILSGLAQITSE